MFGREAHVVRREAPVLLPAVGGFQFGRRPNVVLAVGELFVRARSQARRRVSIRPKAELFARRWRALCPGAKRPWSGAKLFPPAVACLAPLGTKHPDGRRPVGCPEPFGEAESEPPAAGSSGETTSMLIRLNATAYLDCSTYRFFCFWLENADDDVTELLVCAACTGSCGNVHGHR